MMPLRRPLSIRTVLGFAIVLATMSVVTIYTLLQYTVDKERILAHLRSEGQATLAALVDSIPPFMQAYGVSEYTKIIAAAMASENIKAIIVHDQNMAQIVGSTDYVVGRLRDGSEVRTFEVADPGHSGVLQDCLMTFRSDLGGGDSGVAGSVLVCMSGAALDDKLDVLLRETAWIGSMTAVSVVLIVLGIVHVLVLRPISAIAAAVAGRDEAGLPLTDMPTTGAREIAMLGTSVRQMVNVIRTSRRELERQHHELVETEQGLAESEQKLREIIWGTNVGTWEWDVQTGKTAFNERWAEICGYRLGELEPISIETWLSLLHPDDVERSGRALEKVFSRDAEFYECEARMRHKNGGWVWVLDRGKVVEWGEDGRPLRMSGTHTDITVTHEQRERLARLSVAVEQSPVSVVITGPDGDIEYVNEQFERVTGYSFAEVKGRNPRLLQSGDKSREDYEVLWKTILAGETWSGELRNRRKDGSLFWELATIKAIKNDDGEVQSLLGVKEDITERKAVEEALSRSNQELEQFAYVASHDLRQPLRMITSYTQLIERDLGSDIPERTQEFMGYVKNAAHRMDNMLVALLEYSRVGRTGEPMHALGSGDAVEEALRFLEPVIRERQASISLPTEWPIIRASHNEIVRLFQNLIGNALKYCPRERAPEIVLSVQRYDGGYEFAIADNGIGIAPDQIKRLFKVFQRLHRSDEYEGTGIGLAVCRRIAERHGGRIWVTSAGPDAGSTFHVQLPHAEVADAPREPGPSLEQPEFSGVAGTA